MPDRAAIAEITRALRDARDLLEEANAVSDAGLLRAHRLISDAIIEVRMATPGRPAVEHFGADR